MNDILTLCLAADAATVVEKLTKAGQAYVETYGPLNGDALELDTYDPPNTQGQVVLARPGNKVVVHTTVEPG